MIDEGYAFADISVEDDETIALRGNKSEEEQTLPDINQLEL